MTTNLLQTLGWIINWLKSNLDGTQLAVRLGPEFDLYLATVCPSRKALENIRLATNSLVVTNVCQRGHLGPS